MSKCRGVFDIRFEKDARFQSTRSSAPDLPTDHDSLGARQVGANGIARWMSPIEADNTLFR